MSLNTKFFPPTRNVGWSPYSSMSTRSASGRPATMRSSHVAHRYARGVRLETLTATSSSLILPLMSME